MVIPFPLDHAQRFLVLGRDDATLLYQSGLRVGIVAIGVDNRPYSTEVPIYQLRLAFGKRAASGEPRPLTPRGEDNRPHKITDAFRQFAAAMAGDWRDVPSDTEPKERA